MLNNMSGATGMMEKSEWAGLKLAADPYPIGSLTTPEGMT